MSKADPSLPATRFSFRLDFTPGGRLGPGKVQLLEAIGETGSISAAGRSMKMSYRRAWLLVEEMNGMFREPVVSSQRGGKQGGGAHITPFGEEVLARFRAMEKKAQAAIRTDLDWLETHRSPPAEG